MPRREVERRQTTRCAIYTRKSSEEGLEQDFNSLDAQREACESYVRSQRHEGWVLIRTSYDDGGYSGGTMERPALKRLMGDVQTGKVDVIVVYKVDRLTRSLTDFAKMVEVLDAQGASFVSVTQQFNTTTSMGRLTLNVLLSFAQFEREVTGERIRDKIAASKRKGLWMGGLPPLGYLSRERKLVVDDQDAAIVRRIFDRYLALSSVRLLKEELDAAGILSKRRTTATGRVTGGRPFARGALYRMLQNRIYLGEIVHREQSYPGQHEPIIAKATWDKVQQLLRDNRVERAQGKRATSPSLLAGLLFDGNGEPMTPSHAVKRGTRYRYYVSRSLVSGKRPDVSGCRVPAGDIEALVTRQLREWLSDPQSAQQWGDAGIVSLSARKRLTDAARLLAERWPELPPGEQRSMLLPLVARVDLLRESVDIRLIPSRVPMLVQGRPAEATASHRDTLVVSVPARLKRTGLEMQLVLEGERSSEPDTSLLKLVIKARALQKHLLSGKLRSVREIARAEGITGSYATRLLRVSFLAPDITADIINGRHPPDVNAAKLLRHSRFPLHWREQRVAFGFT